MSDDGQILLDGETLRQRRKEKIMSSREDRLAKIMSMASGRIVDPKEIHLDRTPSPSISECAAAGVGPTTDASYSKACPILTTPKLSNLTTTKVPSSSSSSLERSERGYRHLIIIICTALLFCGWHYVANVRESMQVILPAAALPWQVLFGGFTGVEIIEFMTGRVKLTGIFGDASLYLFVVICTFKILE